MENSLAKKKEELVDLRFEAIPDGERILREITFNDFPLRTVFYWGLSGRVNYDRGKSHRYDGAADDPRRCIPPSHINKKKLQAWAIFRKYNNGHG
jgi:hypothetical protein